jgi:hypothetical protein
MDVDQFLAFFNGIFCDYDGADGDQCFDLANNYSRWIGGPYFSGATADLIINQAGTFYTRIDNTPTGFPVKGDIVVWNWPHVGIATGTADENTFEVLEQNDPTNSNCHMKVYPNYDGVIGWLHPNTLPVNLQAELDQTRADRDKNWNLYQADEETKKALQQEFDAYKTSHPDVPQPAPEPIPSPEPVPTPVPEPTPTPVPPIATPPVSWIRAFIDKILKFFNL